jgi:hypothetical protein
MTARSTYQPSFGRCLRPALSSLARRSHLRVSALRVSIAIAATYALLLGALLVTP